MDKGIIIHSLIINRGKILILKRAENTHLGGYWDIPGGTLEDGEDPIKGVIREVYEETGLKVDNPGLFYYMSNVDEVKNKQFLTLIFMSELKTEPRHITIDQNEHSESKWINPEEIGEYKTVNYLAPCIKYFMSKKHPIIK